MQDIPSLLARGSRLFPHEPAIQTNTTSISFSELYAISNQLACAFSSSGIYHGHRVAVLGNNSWQTLVLLHALMDYGAIVVPLNTRFPVQQQLAALRTVSPQFLFSDKQLPTEISNYIPTFMIDDFFTSTSNENAREKPSELLDAERLVSLIFTSGSTAHPKAAVHRYANHVCSALGSNENISLEPGDRWLLSLPLYHVGGLAISFRTVLAGACTVVDNGKVDLLHSIREFEITHLSLVATQLYRLLQEKKAIPVLRQCKAILLGGSAIPFFLLKKAAQYGLPVHTSYGSTEMSSQITTTAPNAQLDALRTSGHVLSGREVKIADDGEILVRGKTRFAGYFLENKIEEVFDTHEYFHTGDLGYFDKHDNLVAQGRKDNLFFSGGENIQPEEIERVLQEVPGVEGAVVVPVADAEFGQRPVAFVRWKGDALAEAELHQHLRGKIAGFKIPDRIFPWPQETEDFKLNRSFFKKKAEKAFG